MHVVAAIFGGRGELRNTHQFKIIFLCQFFISRITTNRDFRTSQDLVRGFLVRVLDFHIGQNLKHGHQFRGPFNVLVIICPWLIFYPKVPEETFIDPRGKICETNFLIIPFGGKCRSLLHLIVAVIFQQLFYHYGKMPQCELLSSYEYMSQLGFYHFSFDAVRNDP